MPSLKLPENRACLFLALIAVLGIVTLALSAATLATLNNKKFESSDVSARTTSAPKLNSVLAETIRLDDLMGHLRQLQRIANESNGTRAINTRGFNETVNYIHNYLTEKVPDLTVFRESFQIRNFELAENPIFISNIGGTIKNYTYSTVLFKSDFTFVIYSTARESTEYLPVINIPNYGCSSSEWQNASGKAALVKAGGRCTYAEKGIIAMNQNASAILFYNNGEGSSSYPPVSARIRYFNELPALSLSYDVGRELVDALNAASTVTVQIQIKLKDLGSFPVDNVCADTQSGDKEQTIVVGSHTDSVPAGPGINDNGESIRLIDGTISALF